MPTLPWRCDLYRVSGAPNSIATPFPFFRVQGSVQGILGVVMSTRRRDASVFKNLHSGERF